MKEGFSVWCLLCVLCWICEVDGYGYYQADTPNGYKVPCPAPYCTGICAGFAHVNNDGSPGCSGGTHPDHKLNQFGNDWNKYGLTWDIGVCTADSDKDGYTNGDELGDPCCVWSTGNTPARTFPITHPAYATSLLSTYGACSSCLEDGVPVVNLTLEEVTSSSALFSWFSPESSCVCAFQLEFSMGTVNFTVDQSHTTQNIQYLNITALDPDTEYGINLVATNLAGGSPIFFPFTTLAVSPNAPPQPNPPTMTEDDAYSMSLTWDTALTTDVVYQLECDMATDVFQVVYTGQQNSYSLDNLASNTTYSFRLRLSNTFGDGFPSDIAKFSTLAIDPNSVKGYISDDGRFKVLWQVTGTTIQFSMTALTTGWVGLGIGHTPTMVHSDMWMGGFDASSGKGYLADCYSSSREQPTADASQDLVLIVASETTSSTTVTFKRKLVTGDSADIPIGNGDLYLLWAYAKTDDLSLMHLESGDALVNFLTGKIEPVYADQVKDAHAGMNFIAWMILIPIGSFIARYFREKLDVWWFRLHVFLQTLGFVMSAIAFVLAFVGVELSGTPHFSNVHSYFGFFLFILAMGQTGLGILSHFKYDPHRKATPIFPDIVHRWFGLFCMLLSIVTVYLGLYYNQVNAGIWFLGVLTVTYCTLIFLVLEFF